MSRECSLCGRPDRPEIDRALVSGEKSNRRIAAQCDVSETAVRRHRSHIPATLAKARDAAEVVRADDLLGRLLELNRETMAILRDARGKDGNPDIALRAIARAEKQLELQAKLLGELPGDGAVTFNVLVAPQWVALQSRMLAALAPYPDARVALADALESEGDHGA